MAFYESEPGDRLIPSRRGSCGSLNQLKLERDENWAPQNGYQEVLSQNVLGTTRSLADVKVLSYQHKPQRPSSSPEASLHVLYSSNREASKPKSNLGRVLPQSAMKVLDAPGIVDDFYSHPLDWSSQNIVAVALADAAFLFHTATGQTEKLLTLPAGNISCLKWTGEGAHLAVGTSTGELQIWDLASSRQLRSLRSHGGRLGAMAWQQHILSSGAADSEIQHHDVRMREHLTARLKAHSDLVCGLDYSSDGILASGGNDNVVCIWDQCNTTSPLYQLTAHRAAVKALKWCPWQRILATGGGSADRQVCIWNGSSGKLLQSADAQSQVTGVAWGTQERELLTAHGYSRNQLSLWKFPSLAKAADIEGHSGRVLGLAQSPDGAVVCSASADETIRFWKVWSPAVEKPGPSAEQKGPNAILKTIR